LAADEPALSIVKAGNDHEVSIAGRNVQLAGRAVLGSRRDLAVHESRASVARPLASRMIASHARVSVR